MKLAPTKITATTLLLGLTALFNQVVAQERLGIEKRINTILSRMTTEQKILLLGGKDTFFTQAVPSGLCCINCLTGLEQRPGG